MSWVLQAKAMRTMGITGPTASGKTAVALALAQRLPVEIISVDSALVYRGMDIGTAKPSAAERAAVPHHLIDVLDPLQSFSAAEFVRQTQTLVGDIHSRGRHALLVGGTMLYFKALIDGLDDLPVADPDIRKDIAQQADQHGWAHMHAQLALVDAPSALRLAPADSQRIARALEVFRITGRAMSSLFKAKDRTSGAFANMPLLSLEPTERTWLHGRITERLQQMFDSGLVAEVQVLRSRKDLHAQLPSMRCVGYRQVWEGLDAGATAAEMKEKSLIATRQLAKRQMTWLRASPKRTVVAADSASSMSEATELALGLLQAGRAADADGAADAQGRGAA